MALFLAVIGCASVLIQGGYFPAFFLWVGAALGVSLLVQRRRLRCPRPLWALGALSAWQLLAAVLSGGGAASLAQGTLPLVCWLYGLLLLSLDRPERRQCLVWMARFGCGAALAAIVAFFGLLPLPGAVTAHRLQFTFQYVNAAGIWFAALLLLRGELKDPWLDRLWPLPAIALVLTRSVGAIGLFVVLQVACLLTGKGKGKPLAWAAAGGAAVIGGIAVATRFQQALGTFQERLVQSGDGLRGMLASPLWGYGAGNWPQVKELFQSYEYQAQVVHNSYVQAGVEGGFPGMLLLLAAVVLALFWLRDQSPEGKASALLIPLHAVMDFTLCFFAVDALAVSTLALNAPEEGTEFPPLVGRLLGAGCILAFVLLALLRG